MDDDKPLEYPVLSMEQWADIFSFGVRIAPHGMPSQAISISKGLPVLKPNPKICLHDLPTMSVGDVHDFLMEDHKIFPRNMLWVTGSVELRSDDNTYKVTGQNLSQASVCFKVLEVKGMTDFNTGTLVDSGGKRHIMCYPARGLFGTRVFVPKNMKDLASPEMLSAMCSSPLVEIWGASSGILFHGVDYGAMEPVLIPEAVGTRMSWDAAVSGPIYEWVLASWKLTVSRYPAMFCRVPECMMMAVNPHMTEAEGSGITD